MSNKPDSSTDLPLRVYLVIASTYIKRLDYANFLLKNPRRIRGEHTTVPSCFRGAGETIRLEAIRGLRGHEDVKRALVQALGF
jgi:hypothetical protein